MTDLKTIRDQCKKFAKSNLQECCAELIEWQDTAILRDGKVRELTALCSTFIANHDGLRVAESFVNRAAIEATIAPDTGELAKLREALTGCVLILERMDNLRHISPEFEALDKARAALAPIARQKEPT